MKIVQENLFSDGGDGSNQEMSDKKPQEQPDSIERYVQIKLQVVESDIKKYHVLKIIDVSKDILYERAKGEQRLLALINATVSHEMRNPINALNSQNIKQAEINEKLKKIIMEDLDQISHRNIRLKLNSVYNEYDGTLKVQKSSSKLLTFLVNDILDFAQLKSGKFRKVISCFNIKEAIQEIYMIQKDKADFMGIQVTQEYEGFP